MGDTPPEVVPLNTIVVNLFSRTKSIDPVVSDHDRPYILILVPEGRLRTVRYHETDMASTDQSDINRTSEHNKKMGIHGDGRHCVVLASDPRANICDPLVGGINTDHLVHGKAGEDKGLEWVGNIHLVETCALNAVPFEWRAGTRDIGVMSTAIALPAHSSPASRASLGSQKPLPVRVLGLRRAGRLLGLRMQELQGSGVGLNGLWKNRIIVNNIPLTILSSLCNFDGVSSMFVA